MKLIEPTFEILEQAPGMDGMLKQIELCGRTCYRSYDKATEGSAEKFVERMKSNQHLSVLEHGAVYLTYQVKYLHRIGIGEYARQQDEMQRLYINYLHNKYSHVNVDIPNDTIFITTNYRVIFENGWEEDLKYQCEPTEYHEKRVTVRFTTDIGISREFNRHRVNSISEQSTRYCNYSKDKFGGEISVVPPIRAREEAEIVQREFREYDGNDTKSLAVLCYDVGRLAEEGEYEESKSFTDIDTWMFANLAAQWSYMRLTNVFGWSAQEARSVLPLDTQTELVHTAFVSDWEHFFELRADEHAHPMARELAIPLREEFVKRGLIKE